MPLHEPFLAARLAILPFALVEWSVVFFYVKLILRAQLAVPMRVVLLGPFIVALAGTVFGQLNVYTALTAVTSPLDTDDFVFWLIVIENIVAAGLLLRMVLRHRRGARHGAG
jgi:hypothetical protein